MRNNDNHNITSDNIEGEGGGGGGRGSGFNQNNVNGNSITKSNLNTQNHFTTSKSDNNNKIFNSSNYSMGYGQEQYNKFANTGFQEIQIPNLPRSTSKQFRKTAYSVQSNANNNINISNQRQLQSQQNNKQNDIKNSTNQQIDINNKFQGYAYNFPSLTLQPQKNKVYEKTFNSSFFTQFKPHQSRYNYNVNSITHGQIDPEKVNKNISISKNFGQGSSNQQFEMLLMQVSSLHELSVDQSKALAVKRGDLSIMQGEVFRCYLKPQSNQQQMNNSITQDFFFRQNTPYQQKQDNNNLTQNSLVVKRLECLDRAMYELKVYELELFQRLRSYPNILPLYSFWPEQMKHIFGYKELIVLIKEAQFGDTLSSIVLNNIKPKRRTLRRYICELARGLDAIHSNELIHGALRPSHIFISQNEGRFSNGVSTRIQIGELKKVELDKARETLQFFSKLLLNRSIAKHLVYWAPELLLLRQYDHHVDLWALGVTIYQIATGRLPFNISDEDSFRKDALEGNVDWTTLLEYEQSDGESGNYYQQQLKQTYSLKKVVENLIVVEPRERWPARLVLLHMQQEFAIIIQKHWRGFLKRIFFLQILQGIKRIQAQWRGWLENKRFRILLKKRKYGSAILIQQMWKKYLNGKDYRRIKKIVVALQHRVLTRQMHRTFLRVRLDACKIQNYMRRYLDIKKGQELRDQLIAIEAGYMQINQNIALLHQEVNRIKQVLPENEMPPNFKYLDTFENYVFTTINNDTSSTGLSLTQYNEEVGEQQVSNQNGKMQSDCLPKLAKIINEINQTKQLEQGQQSGIFANDDKVYDLSEEGLQNICSLLRNTRYQAVIQRTKLMQQQQQGNGENQDQNQQQKQIYQQQSIPAPQIEQMKTAFGEKWTEFLPKQEELINKLIKLKDMMEKSIPLEIAFLNNGGNQGTGLPTQYDNIMESINDSNNKLDNIQLNYSQSSKNSSSQENYSYHAMNPIIDLNLCGHQLCFLSEILLSFGLFVAGSVEVYLTNLLDRWSFIKHFKLGGTTEERIILPDEQWAKYLRIKFLNNTKGGKLVHIRRIIVKGIPKDIAYANCNNI